jgi:hypothetical protein
MLYLIHTTFESCLYSRSPRRLNDCNFLFKVSGGGWDRTQDLFDTWQGDWPQDRRVDPVAYSDNESVWYHELPKRRVYQIAYTSVSRQCPT